MSLGPALRLPVVRYRWALVLVAWRVGFGHDVAPANAAPRKLAMRAASVSRDDLLTVPSSQTMPGWWSAAAALATQFGHLSPTATRPRTYGPTGDVLIGASLFGYLQVDAALQAGFTFVDLPGGPTIIDATVDNLRLGGRLVVPGFQREPGEDGLGLALLFGVELPLSSAVDGQSSEYHVGFAMDYRYQWLHASAFTSVAFRPGSPGWEVISRIDLGGAAKADLYRPFGLSGGLVIDGSIAAAGTSSLFDETERAIARAFAFVDVAIPGRRWSMRLCGGAPLHHLDQPDFLLCWLFRVEFGGAYDVRVRSAPGEHMRRPAPPVPVPVPVNDSPPDDQNGHDDTDGREVDFADSSSRRPSVANVMAMPIDPEAPRAKEVLRDGMAAIVLANQRYLSAALARQGLEVLHEVLTGVAMGAALSAAMVGTTIWAGVAMELTVTLLEWLGLGSMLSLTSERLQQIAEAFAPFLSTILDAHGNEAKIDQAARQYAQAMARITGTLAEALLYTAVAQKLPRLLDALGGTRFADAFRRGQLEAWLKARVERTRGL